MQPHQLRWGDREMETAIKSIECSQVAGLIQKSAACDRSSIGVNLGRMSYVVEWLFPSTVGILAALLPRTLLHEGKEGACNHYHILAVDS